MKPHVSFIIPSSDYVNSTLINIRRSIIMSYQENSFHFLYPLFQQSYQDKSFDQFLEKLLILLESLLLNHPTLLLDWQDSDKMSDVAQWSKAKSLSPTTTVRLSASNKTENTTAGNNDCTWKKENVLKDLIQKRASH